MFRACHSVWLTECFCSHLLLTVLVINIIVVVKMTEGVPMSGSHCQTRHTFSIYKYVMAQMVSNPAAMPETQVRSRCREDPLEEGMATHSSTLAWEIPWIEEPGGLQPVGPKEPGTPEQLTLSLWRVWQGWGVRV